MCRVRRMLEKRKLDLLCLKNGNYIKRNPIVLSYSMLFKNNKNDRQITVNCYKNIKIKKGNVSVNQKRYRKKFNGVASPRVKR